MNSPELKPCPHCGGTDLLVCWNAIYEKHYVRCHTCHMQGPEIYEREAAVGAWNTLWRHNNICPNKLAERVELLSKESTRIMDVAIWLAAAMEHEHELCPMDCDVPPSEIECNQDIDVNGERSCDATKCWLKVALNCTGMYQDHDDYTDSFIELYQSILRKGASESVEEATR